MAEAGVAGEKRGPGAVAPRFRGCLLGLAVGDALGTAVEFQPRGSFATVTHMLGGGPFGLAPGQWTDDTSMALCLAESLVERGFDPRDQMERYCRWHEEGYLSSTGTCFDIGGTVLHALRRYRETGDPFAGPTDPRSAGNGCVMRLAPVAMYAFPDEGLAERLAAESARTTHGAAECVDAARLLGRMLVRALAGQPKDAVLGADAETFTGTPRVVAIAKGAYASKARDEVSGSGYVVACLEAALWCFARAGSFREAVLAAVNLGDDADTTAAVCGQLAGAHWGAGSIPARWLDRLTLRVRIEELAEALLAAATARAGGSC